MADQIIVTGHDLPAGWDAEAAGWTVIELRPAAVEELAEEPEVEPEIAIVEAARAELAL